MKKETTERKLLKSIMDFWWECISKSIEADYQINDLLEKFIIGCGVTYFSHDLDRSVLNLSNSQKRKLYSVMLKSGILEK